MGISASKVVQEYSFEALKLDKDGKPTGVARVGYYHSNPITRWRVRLALWLASNKLTVR